MSGSGSGNGWGGNFRNPFRRESDEDLARESAIIEVLLKVGLAVLLIVFAGMRPDDACEESEVALLVPTLFSGLCIMAFQQRSFLMGAVWGVFVYFSQPFWVPDLATWAWAMVSYLAAGLLLLSVILPVYLHGRPRRRDRPQARKSAPPQHAPKRHAPTRGRTTYPKGDPRAQGKD